MSKLKDELPEGFLTRYERNVSTDAQVLGRRGAVPTQIDDAEYLIPNCSKVPDQIIEREIFIPLFEVEGGKDVR